MDQQTGAERGTAGHGAEALAARVTAQEADEEQLLWSDFADAASVEAFCRSWLALECRIINGVQAGMILLGPADRGPFRPAAVWPDSRRSLKHLTKTAERTLAERRGLVAQAESAEGGAASPTGPYEIGYPIESRGSLYGAVVLETLSKSDARLQAMMRQLHWGAAWLELMFCRQDLAAETETRERLQTALELVGNAVGHERFYGAAMAFVTALATRLQCDRVSLGYLKRNRTQVCAVSHSAEFKKQTNLVRTIGEAMDEALDQRQTVVYPQTPEGPASIVHAHTELARQHGAGAICTIPIEGSGLPVGALTLERPADRPFDPGTVELCQSVAALAGPMLDVHRRDDRWLIAKVGQSVHRLFAALIGPRHVALKVGTLAVTGLLAFLILAEGDYRVTAKTVLEPVIQRAIAAPFDGYIREAPGRAGDLVELDQLLCALDDRELRLERLKALSRLEEYRKEYHKAMAERNAAEVEILTAQMNQAESELALLDDQLAHTRLTAPFDGLIVTGDLSQSLGAPVEKGKVLFEVAPLDAYRVVVEVDERDIADLTEGQQGTVILSAFPDETLPITVEKVTPVSTAEEGRNFFRVEANFDQPHDRLRPGMEGAGKIEIDRRRLIWIWTHQVVDYIRLTVWTWLP